MPLSENDSISFPVLLETKRENGHISYSDEEYITPYSSFVRGDDNGVLAKPRWQSMNDISQFYFKLHVESYSLRIINLIISVKGANDYKFINVEPDSIIGQTLFYTFKTDTTRHCIDKDLMIHVHSNELTAKQNARVFIVTSLISAIIALFLALIVKAFNTTMIDTDYVEMNDLVGNAVTQTEEKSNGNEDSNGNGEKSNHKEGQIIEGRPKEQKKPKKR